MSEPAVLPPVVPAERRPRPRPATVAELLADLGRPLYSFEFFPPRDAEGEAGLWTAVRELEQRRPDFCSVTYGASGSTRDRTVEATRRIAEQTTLRTMAHLTCAAQTRAELRRVVGAYADAGIHHILAVRGDPPGGPTAAWRPHPEGLDNATDLVRLIDSLGDFCIGVAAFPDGHPSGSPDLDADLLVDKADAGATFAITQLFFTAGRHLDLVKRIRDRSCELPIIAGIMPVTQLSQIQRFAELSGADLPDAVTRRLHAAGDDPAAVRAAGIDIAVDLCRELLDAGVPGLHFFTQNRSRATLEIFDRLQ